MQCYDNRHLFGQVVAMTKSLYDNLYFNYMFFAKTVYKYLNSKYAVISDDYHNSSHYTIDHDKIKTL